MISKNNERIHVRSMSRDNFLHAILLKYSDKVIQDLRFTDRNEFRIRCETERINKHFYYEE